MTKPTSETRQTSDLAEAAFHDHHHGTRIVDSGGKVYDAAGRTPEESQQRASEKCEAGSHSSNSSSSSDGGGCSSSGGGSSSCYITTACLDAMHLPRDSLEMRAMKVLTKEHILKSFQGKRDYVLYGRKGPAIVQAIESREDSQEIWRGIYERLKDVTASVLSSNYERGHQLYKELILGLEKQFVGSR